MKIKVGVFFGGNSVEHEISVISALQAINAFDTDKYDVVPVYVTKDNNYYCGEFISKIEEYTDIKGLINKSQRVIFVKGNRKAEIYKFPFKTFSNKMYDYIDIAFPIVHGTNVEDGTFQGFLSYLGVPVAGCDVISSAVGMDKYVMKTVLKYNKIPVLDCIRINSFDYENNKKAVVDKIKESLSFPIIIKPVNLGSSVGIKIAKDIQSLENAIEYSFEFSKEIVAEHAIENLKEINCSVLGDYESAEASECEEPLSKDEILSYKDKYMSSSSNKGMASVKRKCPAEIDDNVREKIRLLAVDTFKVLRCNGVVRIDFMIDNESQEIYVNEINTIPGSLAFYLWKESGINYKDLLTKIIQLALKRQREQEEINYSYDTDILKGFSFGGSKGAKGSKGVKF